MRATQNSGLVAGIDLSANSLDLADPGDGLTYTVHMVDSARQATNAHPSCVTIDLKTGE